MCVVAAIVGTGLVSTGVGAVEASKSNSIAGSAESLASKQAGEQGQYNTMLQGLMNNPSAFLNSPIFQALQQQGIGAAQTTAAGQGYAGSGNEASALETEAQGNAAGELFSQEQILASLTGLGGNAAAQTLGAASSAQSTTAQELGGVTNTLGLMGILASGGLGGLLGGGNGITSGDLAMLAGGGSSSGLSSWEGYTINTPGYQP